MSDLSPVFLLAAAALALFVAAVLLLLFAPVPTRRANRRIARLLAPQAAPARVRGPVRGWPARIAQALSGGLDTAIGRVLVADEDRLLLDRAGFDHLQARALYMGVRIAAAGGFVLLCLLWRPATGWLAAWSLALAAYAGLMLPKWLLRLRARHRLGCVREELPLLVDLLRLLQGSGMSLDQSLRVAAAEFGSALPVLGAELALADRQHDAGLSRAESFRRLTRLYEGGALEELCALLVQLDRHGGAVDEPLKRFGLRLREQRRARMRALVGKRNVQMTTIMVATLLPALVIVIGGPAFLAVIRSLSQVH